MEISGTGAATPSVLTLTGQLSPELKLLKQGQQLPARVLSVTSAQQAELSITGLRVQAQISQPVTPGQSLHLEVIHAGARPVLKIVGQDPLTTVINRVLRQVLPQQTPLADSMTALLRVATEAMAGGHPLPVSVQELLKNLLERSLTRNDLGRAEGVRTAVRDSGFFLEALLASPAGHAGVQNDLKARLLRFRKQLGRQLDGLEGSSPQRAGLQKLLGLSESALARITMNQLCSLRENQGAMPWYLEVPLQYQDGHETVQFKFERYAQTSGDTRDAVTVTARLDLDALGLVEAAVTCLPETIKVVFRAEEAATVEKIRDSLHRLDDDFTAHGLDGGVFYVQQSVLPPMYTLGDSALLDERA